MKYETLTKTQQRCINAFVRLNPSLATRSEISRPEIHELFNTLLTARASGGEKIGYPMWLVRNTGSTRGMYPFPAPNKSVKPTVIAFTPKTLNVDVEDAEFFKDLENYGILEAT